MNNLIISPRQICKLATKSKIVGAGSFGVLYQLNDDILIKFNYKDFVDAYENDNNYINLNKLGSITKKINEIKKARLQALESDLLNKLLKSDARYNELGRIMGEAVLQKTEIPVEEMLELKSIEMQCKQDNKELFEALEYSHPERVNYVINAINKQDKVKHTNLPLGLVLVDGVCVGYVLKNNKNMVNLYTYMEENELPSNLKETILENINIATNELIENGIFHNDLTLRNVMADLKTGEIQIIDTDDITCLTENEMKNNKDWMQIRTGFVKGKLQAINDYIEDNEDYRE